MKNKHCQWCDHPFQTNISYQIYCSSECRDAATKEKIAARYVQTRVNRRKGKVRLCKSCGANLSVYNDDIICSSCHVIEQDVKKAIKDIRGLSNGKNTDKDPNS